MHKKEEPSPPYPTLPSSPCILPQIIVEPPMVVTRQYSVCRGFPAEKEPIGPFSDYDVFVPPVRTHASKLNYYNDGSSNSKSSRHAAVEPDSSPLPSSFHAPTLPYFTLSSRVPESRSSATTHARYRATNLHRTTPRFSEGKS